MKKLPTKIYLRKSELEDYSTQERMVFCDEPFDECVEEYTNIRNLWHSPKKKPRMSTLNVMCELKNGCIIIVNGDELENMVAKGYCKCWAYCDDLHPTKRIR